jgi:YidC/Oxa1 family membrane protein insertase
MHEDKNVEYVEDEIDKLTLTDSEKDDVKKKTVFEKFIFLYGKQGAKEDEIYEKISEYFLDEDNCKNAAKNLKGEDNEKQVKRILEAIKKHNDIDSFMLNEEYISKNLATSRPELMTFSFVNKDGGKYADVLPESVKEAAEDIDYKSFGLDMGVIPSFKNMTWVIPFASFILQIAVTIVSQFFQKKNNPAAAKAMGMGMKITFIILPVFSLWIGFSYPAGLGLYWCYSSLFALLQTIVLNVVYNPEKINALIEAENAKNKKNGKKTMFAKMAEQNLERMGKAPAPSDDDDEDNEERKLSKAEKAAEDRRRIAAARKRMAEKYGEEYQEFADEEEEEKPKPQNSGKKKKNKNRNNNNNGGNNSNKNSNAEKADVQESDEQQSEADDDSEEE